LRFMGERKFNRISPERIAFAKDIQGFSNKSICASGVKVASKVVVFGRAGCCGGWADGDFYIRSTLVSRYDKTGAHVCVALIVGANVAE
jgi:hypothetical protein